MRIRTRKLVTSSEAEAASAAWLLPALVAPELSAELLISLTVPSNFRPGKASIAIAV